MQSPESSESRLLELVADAFTFGVAEKVRFCPSTHACPAAVLPALSSAPSRPLVRPLLPSPALSCALSRPLSRIAHDAIAVRCHQCPDCEQSRVVYVETHYKCPSVTTWGKCMYKTTEPKFDPFTFPPDLDAYRCEGLALVPLTRRARLFHAKDAVRTPKKGLG